LLATYRRFGQSRKGKQVATLPSCQQHGKAARIIADMSAIRIADDMATFIAGITARRQYALLAICNPALCSTPLEARSNAGTPFVPTPSGRHADTARSSTILSREEARGAGENSA
jgi:hypothetical protein